jgi:hypothetical protein
MIAIAAKITAAEQRVRLTKQVSTESGSDRVSMIVRFLVS